MIDDVYVRQRCSIYYISILGSIGTCNLTVNHSRVKSQDLHVCEQSNKTRTNRVFYVNIINNI